MLDFSCCNNCGGGERESREKSKRGQMKPGSCYLLYFLCCNSKKSESALQNSERFINNQIALPGWRAKRRQPEETARSCVCSLQGNAYYKLYSVESYTVEYDAAWRSATDVARRRAQHQHQACRIAYVYHSTQQHWVRQTSPYFHYLLRAINKLIRCPFL